MSHKKMVKRLAKTIRKFGRASEDENALAEYLVNHGWRDTEKRPKVQQVTVIPSPSIPMAMRSPLTQLGDAHSMKPDYEKIRYVQWL